MPDARKSRGGTSAIAAQDDTPKTTVLLDPLAALFRERWEQECIRSLLMAEEVRKLRGLVAQQQSLIESLRPKQEGDENGGTA